MRRREMIVLVVGVLFPLQLWLLIRMFDQSSGQKVEDEQYPDPDAALPSAPHSHVLSIRDQAAPHASSFSAPLTTLVPSSKLAPNVLLVISDDHRSTALGCLMKGASERSSADFGPLVTPRLDDIATRGVVFRRAYTSGSTEPAVCAPSRAGLLTGRALWRSHCCADCETDACASRPNLIPPGVPTLPQLLSSSLSSSSSSLSSSLPSQPSASYETMLVGKWHNGKERAVEAFDVGRAVMFRGMSGHTDIPAYDFERSRGMPTRNGRSKGVYSTNLFADAAIDLLRQREFGPHSRTDAASGKEHPTHKSPEQDSDGDNDGDSDRPFFMWLAFTAPHDPRTPSQNDPTFRTWLNQHHLADSSSVRSRSARSSRSPRARKQPRPRMAAAAATTMEETMAETRGRRTTTEEESSGGSALEAGIATKEEAARRQRPLLSSLAEPPLNWAPRHPFDNGELQVRDEQLLDTPRRWKNVEIELSKYYQMIEHLDYHLGRVVDVAESCGSNDGSDDGRDDGSGDGSGGGRTVATGRHPKRRRPLLIVYCSDHGISLGQHGLLGKQNLYEHSVRTLLIFGGSAISQRRAHADAAGAAESATLRQVWTPVYLHDVMPSVIELASAPVGKVDPLSDARLATLSPDARSLVPLIDNALAPGLSRVTIMNTSAGMMGSRRATALPNRGPRPYLLLAYRELQRAVVDTNSSEGFKLIEYFSPTSGCRDVCHSQLFATSHDLDPLETRNLLGNFLDTGRSGDDGYGVGLRFERVADGLRRVMEDEEKRLRSPEHRHIRFDCTPAPPSSRRAAVNAHASYLHGDGMRLHALCHRPALALVSG